MTPLLPYILRPTGYNGIPIAFDHLFRYPRDHLRKNMTLTDHLYNLQNDECIVHDVLAVITDGQTINGDSWCNEGAIVIFNATVSDDAERAFVASIEVSDEAEDVMKYRRASLYATDEQHRIRLRSCIKPLVLQVKSQIDRIIANYESGATA